MSLSRAAACTGVTLSEACSAHISWSTVSSAVELEPIPPHVSRVPGIIRLREWIYQGTLAHAPFQNPKGNHGTNMPVEDLGYYIPMHMDLLIIAAEVFGVLPFLCLCSFIPRTDHA